MDIELELSTCTSCGTVMVHQQLLCPIFVVIQCISEVVLCWTHQLLVLCSDLSLTVH